MSGYLLALSLGPVQDFIASARRTRDLWFGSYLLSEVSKAAAKAIHDAGATLIFPAPVVDEQLDRASEFNVANKILAAVPEGKDPAAIADSAFKAAQGRWHEFADNTYQQWGTRVINKDIWREQLDDVIEFYAAWVPYDEQYSEVRARVVRLLAGRKALRDFVPAKGRAGVPKSSLDGARESVLTQAVRRDPALRVELRIKKGEHLDAVGLVKRVAKADLTGGRVSFVSVTRVAADPWIRGASASPEGRQMLKEISLLCRTAFAGKISEPQYQDFPLESDILYPSRLQILKKEPDLSEHAGVLKAINTCLVQYRSESKAGEPSPYFAVLSADGDRMGLVIEKIDTPEEHRKFSKALSEFTFTARKIIEESQGCLVYSGGDDVLAFLPVDRCIAAARQLRDEFHSRLQTVDIEATLSVGIAIGHCMEPLEDHLRLAREAEKAAKAGHKQDGSDERDGLAVSFWTRGGGCTAIRDQWKNNPDNRLDEWSNLLILDRLPDKAAYDLRALAEDYNGWPDKELPLHLLKDDAKRLLRRKRADGKELPAEIIDKLLENVRDQKDLTILAAELIIARQLAAGKKMASGSGSHMEVTG